MFSLQSITGANDKRAKPTGVYCFLFPGFIAPFFILITLIANSAIVVVLSKKNMQTPTNTVLLGRYWILPTACKQKSMKAFSLPLILMCTLRRRHGTLRLRNDPVSSARPHLHVHSSKPRPTPGTRQFLLHLLFLKRDASFTVPHRKHLVNSRACLSAVSSLVTRCVAQAAKYRIFLSTGTSTYATRLSREYF